MLNDEEAVLLTAWSKDAKGWAEASHEFVAASTTLATSSRDLATRIEANGEGISVAERKDLSGGLQQLALVVEDGAKTQRGDYLGTEESLGQLHSLLD